MVECIGVGHFSIPVSDLDRSIKFYAEVVGCKLLVSDGKKHAFMDAGGICLLLCADNPPINQPDARDHVHHAFVISSDDLKTATEHLTAHGVEILYSEDREGGTVNGPRTYFRDPDGTRLEFLDMTSYDPNPR
ncbi:MAG: hypothetical protein HN658_08825 [Rhodospirillales bacterium]|jgi:catechol 2,3-dioxygenase-like lactoylglutathione lyase family enzyme|nr:hypothetical protein [Rhodospirillales bacterium]MBT4007313.1 hypothetical protein [Rhodospirillales bacterium]MBT5076983.1 hypothetical protein [Rhodospirillales bacterium]MBT5113646.1 hypothetical protein [Rhodospirillales bacterium]MBT5673944.1 hypothetical protein [Rhodospirillales bacterium]